MLCCRIYHRWKLKAGWQCPSSSVESAEELLSYCWFHGWVCTGLSFSIFLGGGGHGILWPWLEPFCKEYYYEHIQPLEVPDRGSAQGSPCLGQNGALQGRRLCSWAWSGFTKCQQVRRLHLQTKMHSSALEEGCLPGLQPPSLIESNCTDSVHDSLNSCWFKTREHNVSYQNLLFLVKYLIKNIHWCTCDCKICRSSAASTWK